MYAFVISYAPHNVTNLRKTGALWGRKTEKDSCRRDTEKEVKKKKKEEREMCMCMKEQDKQ